MLPATGPRRRAVDARRRAAAAGAVAALLALGTGCSGGDDDGGGGATGPSVRAVPGVDTGDPVAVARAYLLGQVECEPAAARTAILLLVDGPPDVEAGVRGWVEGCRRDLPAQRPSVRVSAPAVRGDAAEADWRVTWRGTSGERTGTVRMVRTPQGWRIAA